MNHVTAGRTPEELYNFTDIQLLVERIKIKLFYCIRNNFQDSTIQAVMNCQVDLASRPKRDKNDAYYELCAKIYDKYINYEMDLSYPFHDVCVFISEAIIYIGRK